MIEALLVVSVALLVVLVVIGVALLLRRPPVAGADHTADLAALRTRVDGLFESNDRLEKELTGELVRLRGETGQSAMNLRTEVREVMTAQATSINQTLTASGGQQHQQLTTAIVGVNTAVSERLGDFSKRLTQLAESNTIESSKLRTELSGTLSAHATRLNGINEALVAGLEKVRGSVESKLTVLQQSNEQRLEQMRATVDEKLQSTLERRLGESFKQVAERLDGVQKGFGEMQALAGNVTDLRRLMTNVKTRGTWGEVQLANLLEQLFSPAQYIANYKPRRTGEVVEFALRLPGGASGGSDEPVYLPIDSKFPIEDYQRLVAASEGGDAEAVNMARKALENRIWQCAQEIRNKYIVPPATTDFALLFLPTEALHGEVLRIEGLCEGLQRDCRVMVVGPTTFSAIATALLVGFHTLRIQKSTAAVGKLLGQVKADFGKFAQLLDTVDDKLDSAKKTVTDAKHRSNQIVRKLERVEETEGVLPGTPPTPGGLNGEGSLLEP